MTTDTPKRLSDELFKAAENARGVIDDYLAEQRENMDAISVEYFETAADQITDALLSHIAALTAPPSQGKVERAREILKAACAPYMYKYWEDRGYVSIGTAIAAITQALTAESSGQGTDGAQAMREAAAGICDEEAGVILWCVL